MVGGTPSQIMTPWATGKGGCGFTGGGGWRIDDHIRIAILRKQILGGDIGVVGRGDRIHFVERRQARHRVAGRALFSKRQIAGMRIDPLAAQMPVQEPREHQQRQIQKP